MRLSLGDHLGPYELLELLGAGGMGEVYKARDTRLDRIVAIKVPSLPFTDSPDRRARFEREAHAAAALNHPHICNLLDVASAVPSSAAPAGDSIPFLVIEYLEGETLSDRLLKGPLPPSEMMGYAIELADALEHAHQRGLVHRDLKPGNIILTKSGAKLLDFGLSRWQTKPNVPDLSTVSSDAVELTADNAVLGTFPYMAPEQLSGREADARSDIFAFGAVLYEMATGQRAFDGATNAAIIGAILHTDPPGLSSPQPVLAPELARIVSRCLAKDPYDRWQTARDLTIELRWIADQQPPPIVDRALPEPRTHRILAAASLAIVVAALTAIAMLYLLPLRDQSRLVRLPFAPPEGVSMTDVAAGGIVAISPDGRRVAFVGKSADGRQLLWVRPLDSLEAQALPGTDGAEDPFWSPGSDSIGFFAQRKLKRIQLSGGPPLALCDAVQPRGGAWNRDNVMLFSANGGHRLYRVSAAGGPATPIPADGKNEERYWPSFLPDGRHYLYRGRPQRHGIYAASIDSSDATLVLDGYVSAAYAQPGYLLGLVGSSLSSPFGTLFAYRFDARQLRTTGEPVAVAEQVIYRVGMARGGFSVSETGTLVYGTSETLVTRLTWFDRSGKPLGNVGGSASYNSPALSPDEKTIVTERFDADVQSEDLWLIDAARDVPSRFTSYPNADALPVWSPDATRIVFASPRGTPPNLYQKALNGDGSEELLVKSKYNNAPSDWSRDGRFLVFATLDPITQWDLWLLPMSGDPADRQAAPLLQTPNNEVLGQFSPDGRWLAYVSDESGTNEVYVRAFPGRDLAHRISVSGGGVPKWRPDGKELFYLAPDSTLMAVTVGHGDAFQAGPSVPVFRTRVAGVGSGNNWGYNPNYTVTHDGQRFLINTLTQTPQFPTTVVLNWPAALQR